ncbi:MAG: hypothetical protein FWD91_03145 [Treponema sp.]|nr:hypothetical protein [Treponema sp.]
MLDEFEQEISDALGFRLLVDLADIPQAAQGTEYHDRQCLPHAVISRCVP